jgi:hypothetical protein
LVLNQDYTEHDAKPPNETFAGNSLFAETHAGCTITKQADAISGDLGMFPVDLLFQFH